MALQKQVIDLPIQTGLQQKVDPRLIQVGAHTTLSNVVQDKVGSLAKRPGTLDLGVANQGSGNHTFRSMANGNVDARFIPSQPAGLAQANNFYLWARGSSDYPGSNISSYAYPLDYLTHLVVERFGIEIGPRGFSSFDSATDGVHIFVAWTAYDTSSVYHMYYCVLDAATLEPLMPPQVFSSGNWVRIASTTPPAAAGINGPYAAIVYQTGSTLYGVTYGFQHGVGGFYGIVTLATDCSTSAGSGCYDLSWVPNSSSQVVLTYATNAATPIIKSTIYTVPAWTAGTSNSTSTVASKNIYGVAVSAQASGTTWVAYSISAGTTTQDQHGFGLDAVAMTTTVADTLLWSYTLTPFLADAYRLSILQLTSTTAMICGAWSSAGIASSLYWGTFNTSAVWTNTGNRYGLNLASKPFQLQGKNCALVLYNEGNPTWNNVTVNPTYYVVELQSFQTTGNDVRPLATIAPRIAIPTSALLLPQAMTIGNRVLTLGASLRAAQGTVGVDIIDIEYNYSLWQPAVLGGVTYLSGGVPCAFDGQRVTEIGFLYQPPSIGASVATTGGGVGPASGSYTYTYAVVYEWRDAAGQRAQSRPTYTTATCTTPSCKVTLTVPPLNLTLRQDYDSNYLPQVSVAIYRDTATAPGNLVRLFVGDVPAALLNVYQSASLSYADTATDTNIAANEGLYTLGGVLDAVCPSSFSGLIVHNNRLAGIGDDGVTVWFSTQYDDGTTQPYFNDSLFTVVGDQGRITALASMDGQLIVYKAASIYIVGGDGPTITGTGNGWTTPQRLQTDVGCTSDWRSVVSYSKGVVFQNGTKLYLLTRGLEATYFSAAVEDVLAANPVITSATNHYARNELRFTCKPTESATTGIVVNYNYVTETWSTFVYYDSDAAGTGANIDTSIVVNGVWYHGNQNGRVWQESASANHYDVDTGLNNHWITWTSATAWAKAGGVQGFGRFWDAIVMAQSVAPHDLTISVGYNYADTYTDVRTFTAAQIAAFNTPQPQCRVNLTQQKAEAVRIQITDAPPTGVTQTTGDGPNLLMPSLVVGAKQGRFRLPAAQGQ